MIESVKIIHDELVGGEARFLADYFRLAGIYVSECTLRSNEKAGDFSAVIVIDKGLTQEEISKVNELYKNVFFIRPLVSFANKTIKETYLNSLLRRLEKTIPDMCKNDRRVLRTIAYIYVKHDLLYYRYAYSYFYEKKELVQETQNKFVEAFIELSTLLKQYNKNVYMIYAKMMLARYINETCAFLKQSFLFDTGKCLEELDEALELEPYFSNIYFLKAVLAEMDEEFKYESEAYYAMAVKNLPEVYFASYSYYRFGRYCEKVLKQEGRAKEYYERAIGINSREYRAYYKLILIAKKEKKYKEAIEYCKLICSILKRKKDNNYLHPREYEYLFKAYLEMTKIYRNNWTDVKALEEALRNRNSVCPNVGNNGIYTQIFGADAQKFLQLTAERLNTVVLMCDQ